jgi:hypothetical protein
MTATLSAPQQLVNNPLSLPAPTCSGTFVGPAQQGSDFHSGRQQCTPAVTCIGMDMHASGTIGSADHCRVLAPQQAVPCHTHQMHHHHHEETRQPSSQDSCGCSQDDKLHDDTIAQGTVRAHAVPEHRPHDDKAQQTAHLAWLADQHTCICSACLATAAVRQTSRILERMQTQLQTVIQHNSSGKPLPAFTTTSTAEKIMEKPADRSVLRSQQRHK